MKKLFAFLFLLLFAIPVHATVLVPNESWEAGWGTWNHNYNMAEIVTDVDAHSGTHSLRYTLNNGSDTGNSPDIVAKAFSSVVDEVWIKYWMKLSSNWGWPSIGDKFVFVWAGTSNNYMGLQWGNNITFSQQTSWDGSINNMASEPPQMVAGQWHEIVIHGVINTGGVDDGVVQVWLDGTRVVNVSTIQWRNAGQAALRSIGLECVWGGPVGTRTNGPYYVWYDDIQVQTTPFGATGDQSPPYVDTFSPGDGSTGVAVGTTSASFHFKDLGDGADNTSLTVACSSPSIATKNCGDANFACSGTSADYTATLSGLSLTYGQAVSCTINGQDLAATPNIMSPYTYNFTVEVASPEALAVTTTTIANGTEGAAYSATVSATGGTSPYAWSIVADALPTGLSLAADTGAISGVPTTAGTSSFTVRATDAVSATDDQVLSIAINPAVPTGQTTVIIQDIADTYIWPAGGANGDNNVSSSEKVEVYQWPSYSWANRILDNISLASLPANISITAASLEMYMYKHEGSGGASPMRTYVYRVTGTVPNISTVTGNNFAGTLGAPLPAVDVSLTPDWYSFNVLEAVQAAYAAGTPMYLAIDGGSDGAADTNRVFASMDHGTTAWRPRLKVSYTQLSAPGGTSAPTPGKGRWKGPGRFRSFH